MVGERASDESVIVIGHGSIGARHVRCLEAMNVPVTVVSRRQGVHAMAVPSIEAAVEARPSRHALVANETSRHRATVGALEAAGFKGRILVEKPVWDHNEPAFFNPEIDVRAAFVLRFHPVIAVLRAALAGDPDPVVAADLTCASYLPDWRPGQDYRQTASAKRADGGGALRDLTHELDLARLLLGPYRIVHAMGGRLSALEIETDDVWRLHARAASGTQIHFSLDYLRRPPRREITLYTAHATYVGDLLAGQVTRNGDLVADVPPLDRDRLYIDQLQAFLSLDGGALATLEEGLSVAETVAEVEALAPKGACC